MELLSAYHLILDYLMLLSDEILKDACDQELKELVKNLSKVLIVQ